MEHPMNTALPSKKSNGDCAKAVFSEENNCIFQQSFVLSTPTIKRTVEIEMPSDDHMSDRLDAINLENCLDYGDLHVGEQNLTSSVYQTPLHPLSKCSLKRTISHTSIEGTPLMPNYLKRIDTSATPTSSIYQQQQDYFPEDEFLDLSSCRPINLTYPSDACVDAAPRLPMTHKVSIICSAHDNHDTGIGHQENPLRTALLVGHPLSPQSLHGDPKCQLPTIGCLRRNPLKDHIQWLSPQSIRDINLVDIMRVHDFEYLSHLESKAREMNLSNSLESTSLHPSFYAPKGLLDSDTPVSPQSLQTAKDYCSAALTAIDIAMKDFIARKSEKVFRSKLSPISCSSSSNSSPQTSSERVFVLGRPPGHHAGPFGCVVSSHFWRRPDMASSGFCFLNVVAIAAAYARYKYGNLAQSMPCNFESNEWFSHASLNHPSRALPTSLPPPKVAIIDFDIHHGNGTEEIVRNLRSREVYFPLPSSWTPMSRKVYKPWLNESDYEDILFASIQLTSGENFYPGSGIDEMDGNIINIGLTPVGPGPFKVTERQRLSAKLRQEYCNQASAEFRKKVSEVLLPKLVTFNPDLILLSSGFDGHYDDLYHFLTEDDYHWITQSLCQIGDQCHASVVSILEGGYSLHETGSSHDSHHHHNHHHHHHHHSNATSNGNNSHGSNSNGRNSGRNQRNLRSSGNNGISTNNSNNSTSNNISSATSTSTNNDDHNSSRFLAPSVLSTSEAALGETINTTTGANAMNPMDQNSSIDKTLDMLTMKMQNLDYKGPFATLPGDGGLVKGVLAHVAALAGLEAFVSSQD